jgi:hypothetical protein
MHVEGEKNILCYGERRGKSERKRERKGKEREKGR